MRGALTLERAGAHTDDTALQGTRVETEIQRRGVGAERRIVHKAKQSTGKSRIGEKPECKNLAGRVFSAIRIWSFGVSAPSQTSALHLPLSLPLRLMRGALFIAVVLVRGNCKTSYISLKSFSFFSKILGPCRFSVRWSSYWSLSRGRAYAMPISEWCPRLLLCTRGCLLAAYPER